MSAAKRARGDKNRNLINRKFKSRAKTFMAKVLNFVKAGDKKSANEALKEANSALSKAQNRGVFKKNKVARIMSRLNSTVKVMQD